MNPNESQKPPAAQTEIRPNVTTPRATGGDPLLRTTSVHPKTVSAIVVVGSLLGLAQFNSAERGDRFGAAPMSLQDVPQRVEELQQRRAIGEARNAALKQLADPSNGGPLKLSDEAGVKLRLAQYEKFLNTAKPSTLAKLVATAHYIGLINAATTLTNVRDNPTHVYRLYAQDGTPTNLFFACYTPLADNKQPVVVEFVTDLSTAKPYQTTELLLTPASFPTLFALPAPISISTGGRGEAILSTVQPGPGVDTPMNTTSRTRR